MLVSGLTGMPTPNMTEADKASFARGKAAGAISVPVVAGAALGASALPSVIAGGTEPGLQTFEAAKGFASSQVGQDLIKLVLKHAGEAVLTGGAGIITYEGIHQAAKLLGLSK
jgi:hypothetical protein